MDMPPRIGDVVRVIEADGRELYGRCRIGYFGEHVNAGHFEVEFTGRAPGLYPWAEVHSVYTGSHGLPPGTEVPQRDAAYSPHFLTSKNNG